MEKDKIIEKKNRVEEVLFEWRNILSELVDSQLPEEGVIRIYPDDRDTFVVIKIDDEPIIRRFVTSSYDVWSYIVNTKFFDSPKIVGFDPYDKNVNCEKIEIDVESQEKLDSLMKEYQTLINFVPNE